MKNKPKALYYSVLEYQPENRQKLDTLFDVVEIESPASDSLEILGQIEIAFAPLGFDFGKKKIDAMPLLKIIASNTTGEPHIDREYAESKGIVVVSLKDEQEFLATITPTAEHAWGLLLALTRRVPWAFQSVLEGKWNRRPWGARAMLSRLSIGIVGYGRLGSLVAEYAHAFRMNPIYIFDPNISRVPEWAVQTETLDELVSKSDCISVHVPALPETEKMFSRDILNTCKKGSVFINTSRGELVDEEALVGCLENGVIAGAALDVFNGEYAKNRESLLQESPLFSYAQKHDTLLLTPHIGGSTLDAWRETEARTIEIIEENSKTWQK
ncbi:hydroxyacid dehydrogenase [Candidatus Kaiserbacteria bacterium CG10_big_fil_rev_8_21_14_0_10_49_17]|uniref:Hydroxyacid dehydrogenase n=1 Tax=Candidatus Kaiserbacteria bacterium CG10_big_fil_rev_8_21_14_0_10_49_17 TaxID=1974609 RepID=A0A2M6WDX2_9BACT|nr:MAG: hydroxyacid dehydrogenase [Candidatus Kaiserbacteria bacterium CG10_big_fil_rev_8_21_14_0_10_49_17]